MPSAAPDAAKGPAKRGPKAKPDHMRRERVNARLSRWVLDWLEGQPQSIGETIERALVERYHLKPPA